MEKMGEQGEEAEQFLEEFKALERKDEGSESEEWTELSDDVGEVFERAEKPVEFSAMLQQAKDIKEKEDESN